MSIVDLAKARAYAATGLMCTDTAADWILSLADEVESLQRALTASRATTQAALGEGVRLAAERDAAVTALQELYGSITGMLREARHIVDHHPEPAASAAAMRILNERTP